MPHAASVAPRRDGKKQLQKVPMEKMQGFVRTGMPALVDAAKLQQDVLSPFLPDDERFLGDLPIEYLEGKQPIPKPERGLVPRLPGPVGNF